MIPFSLLWETRVAMAASCLVSTATLLCQWVSCHSRWSQSLSPRKQRTNAACIRVLIHPVKMYVYLPAHHPHCRKGKPSGGQDHRSQLSWGTEMPRVSCPGSGSVEMCGLTEQESVLIGGLGAWRMPGRPPVAVSESGKCSRLHHHFPELGRSCIK